MQYQLIRPQAPTGIKPPSPRTTEALNYVYEYIKPSASPMAPPIWCCGGALEKSPHNSDKPSTHGEDPNVLRQTALPICSANFITSHLYKYIQVQMNKELNSSTYLFIQRLTKNTKVAGSPAAISGGMPRLQHNWRRRIFPIIRACRNRKAHRVFFLM